MKTEPNATAHPIKIAKKANGQGVVIEYDNHFGLTKREYFAGQFAMGFASAGSTGMPDKTDLARYIVEATDALIAQLNKD